MFSYRNGFTHHSRKANREIRWRDLGAIFMECIYNLNDDPDEHNNVAEKHLQISAMFAEYLKTARTKTLNWPLDD
jgi:hypothetical protein